MQRNLANQLLASTAAIALVALLVSNGSAQSPQAPTVAAGSIAVTRQGATTIVTQGTDKGIIDWRSFSIGPQEAVRFDQPGRSSVTLNRVTGTEQSRIDGNLSATGQVWLANPNGVLIGNSGQVNVGGLLATTGRIDPQAFLSLGKAQIDQIPKNAGVINAGSILAGEGGYAALAAAAAENKGVIQARAGTIAMGAGKAMTLDFAGDKLIQFQVTQPLDQKPDGADALITNSGDLSAPDGAVLLSARAAKGVIDNVINLKGNVIANSIRIDGGSVVLGDGGAVQIGGKLDVSNPAGPGGKLEITGPEVIVAPTAVINASGAAGGGSVKVKAAAVDVKPKAQITARAVETGAGGRISLRADQNLNVAAPIIAKGGDKAGDGGAIELASAGSVKLSSALNADAPAGRGGAVLVAGGLTIAMSGAQISAVGMTGGGMVSIGAYLSDAGYIVASPRLLSLTDSVIDASADFNTPTQMVRILDDGRMLNVPLPHAAIASARGGAVALAGKSVTIATDSAIKARGRDAQFASLGAKLQADAINGAGNGAGGRIDIAAHDLSHQGKLDASGAQGGAVNLAGQAVFQSGSVKADGNSGKGGNASIVATMNYQATSTATIQAKGKSDGGTIRILGTADGTDSAPAIARIFTSGTLATQGEAGKGGAIDIIGRDLLLVAAQLDASGAAGGGTIRIGGDWQGAGPLAHAKTLLSTGPTTFNASALKAGDGGKVVIWSDESTRFGSRVLAKGADGGAGGAVEVSSKGDLTYGGTVEAGKLLLDPKNIVIDASAGGISSVALTDPGAGGTGYGTTIQFLSNGNLVVTSPNDSAGAVSNRGAAYLFNGTTGALISSVTGSTANDKVSSDGVTVLSFGNYLISSRSWNNGGTAANAGAVTWANGTSGVSGVVSAANSLVGSTENDRIGSGGLTPLYINYGLTNYLIRSPDWNNGGTAANAGAVTWLNATTGIVGAVSAANSLVGSTTNDRVGRTLYSDYVDNGVPRTYFYDGVRQLNNGNYLVLSPYWNNGGTAANAGAVTWGNGTTGIVGAISAANSLVGSTENDRVGSFLVNNSVNTGVTATNVYDGVTPLYNYGTSSTTTNYLVRSPYWNNGGTAANAGAVTWLNGTTGIVGAVSAANSLVGSTTNDRVGYYQYNYDNYVYDGVQTLNNGTYLIRSTDWNNGGTAANAGAVTRVNGTTGIVGAVSAANSLVGSTANDRVGSGGVRTLYNYYSGATPSVSNYVIVSPDWNNGGTAANAGAVTWVNGTTGIVGAVSAANSLVGSTAYDRVGNFGVATLNDYGVTTPGVPNYVVISPYWNNGGTAASAGAVTWANGTTGIVGAVSAANSLVGSTAYDYVGWNGVTTLSNRNYVVVSPYWNNGGTAANAGAVTWGNGTTGIVGAISAANSLVGSSTNDRVGRNGVRSLYNGAYLVLSPFWNNGGTAANAGAVTWGNGTTGIVGAVSAANSLVGSTENDRIGSYFFDNYDYASVTTLTNGNYLVFSPSWNNGGTAANAGAVTWGNGTTGIVGAVSAANSLVGSTANDRVGNYSVKSYVSNGATYTYTVNSGTTLSNGNYLLINPSWNNGGTAANAGAVTWGNGTTGVTGAVSAANSLVGSTENDRVGGGDVRELDGGNYLVFSGNWSNGGTAANAGAVTWGSGTSGVTGAVSAANSLVGSTTNDRIGGGGVTTLYSYNYPYFNSGNSVYLIRSPDWNNGGTAASAGAVTWLNATTGIVGAVSAANSLVGSTVNDRVGSGGITQLYNYNNSYTYPNYLVSSPSWNNGGTAANAGAVTWGSGTSGVTGAVSAANSLVGSTTNDRIGGGGGGVTTLYNPSGFYNYLVRSPDWNNGGTAASAGAVTWGSGTSGVSGAVSALNSLVGSTENDRVGSGGVSTLYSSNGYYYLVSSPTWNNGGTAANAGAVTWGSGTTGSVGAVSASNSAVGQAGDYLTFAGGNYSGAFGVVKTANARLSLIDLADLAAASTGTVANSTFSDQPGADATISAANLASTLAAGTSITLQANNDISVNSAINVSGVTGGALTLQAGRSVLVNASIVTANGKLTIVANERTGNGALDAYRDAGAGAITMASGASINSGNGDLVLRVHDDAGLTNHTGGDITLQAITTRALTVENLGAGGVNSGGTIEAPQINAASSLAITAKGGEITASVGGKTGADTATQINLAPGSKITVNGVALNGPAAPTTVSPPADTPTVSVVPTILSTPTVPSVPVLVTSQTVAPTVASTPPLIATAPVATVPIAPVLALAAPTDASSQVQSDISRVQAQILTPPLRFDDGRYTDPEASADPVVAARAAERRGSAAGEEQRRATEVGLNAAATVNAVRLTPTGGLIPPTSPLVPSTGAPLTASPTVKVDPADSGGPSGQAISASVEASATGAGGQSLPRGLSFQSRRPSSDANGRPPPLAETPSETNDEAFLD